VSRLSSEISTKEEREAARRIREALATYHQSEDLINLGAYVSGSNPKLDSAIRSRAQLLDFLQQDASAKAPLLETAARMCELAKRLS
jgi:flagellar biosynthesis/type III secretory pathway ATPase